MQDDEFEWDDDKAARNAVKHGVTFGEARRTLDDASALEELDPDPHEVRWKRYAFSGRRVLAVVYTERGARKHIISAWKATRHEQNRYYRQALP